MFAQVSEGALISFLASARKEAFAAATQGANRPHQIGKETPLRHEDIGQFLSTLTQTNDLRNFIKNYLSEAPLATKTPFALDADREYIQRATQVLLTNKVKKCSSCNKPNGFTLSVCNQCGADLTQVDVSHTNNVFSGFAFGFEKAGPIPLKISLRSSTRDFIVMDDLLALAPLHFNVIPTSQYIPDWRYLLLYPERGLRLITEMYDACVAAGKVLMSQEEWRSKFFRTASSSEAFDFYQHIGAGFNYPPSQYQLHIQFIAPCMLPFQWAQTIKGVHFTYKRFFPFAFVKEVLQRLVAEGLSQGVLTAPNSPTEISQAYFDTMKGNQGKEGEPYCLRSADGDALPDLDRILRFTDEVLGISYLEAHTKHMSNFAKHQSLFSNWAKDDFAGMIVTSTSASQTHTDAFVPFTHTQPSTNSPNQIISSDKHILQSYGRPYEKDSPSGCYYDFPKNFNDVELW